MDARDHRPYEIRTTCIRLAWSTTPPPCPPHPTSRRSNAGPSHPRGPRGPMRRPPSPISTISDLMPPDLRRAHQALDRAVDRLYHPRGLRLGPGAGRASLPALRGDGEATARPQTPASAGRGKTPEAGCPARYARGKSVRGCDTPCDTGGRMPRPSGEAVVARKAARRHPPPRWRVCPATRLARFRSVSGPPDRARKGRSPAGNCAHPTARPSLYFCRRTPLAAAPFRAAHPSGKQAISGSRPRPPRDRVVRQPATPRARHGR